MAKIILINGPSGAGKSTTSKALMKEMKGVWALVSQDDVRDLVKTGYESANGMVDTWSASLKNQMAVSIPICCDMIRRYNEFGMNCILDFYADPTDFTHWKSELKGLDYVSFILLPDVATAVGRNNERTGTARLSDEKVRVNHAMFDIEKFPKDVHFLDTTSMPVSKVVTAIKSEL